MKAKINTFVPETKINKMNTTLWIIQGILAAMFLMAGLTKSTQSLEKLLKSGLAWAERYPMSTVRFIGVSELLGGLGLILPGLLGFYPILTPLSASALSLVMILAMLHHNKHKETKAIAFNLVLLLLAAFVAYGRFSTL